MGPELSAINIIDMEVMYKNGETDFPVLENIKDIFGNVALKLTSKYVIKNALDQRKKDWILVAKIVIKIRKIRKSLRKIIALIFHF